MSFKQLSELVKADGSISPTDVAWNGTLTSAQSDLLIETILNKSEFLKKVTVHKMSKLIDTMSGFSIGRGNLIRHIYGQAPTETQNKKLNVVGCKLDATNGVALRTRILLNTLIDNKNNPNFESKMFDKFAEAFEQDLVYLGFIGEADNDAQEAPFKELSKGWNFRIKELAGARKLNVTTNNIFDMLKELVKSMPDQIRNKASIVMNPTDYDNYIIELGTSHQNTALIVNANAKSFMGYPIEVESSQPQNEAFATPLANLVFGIANEIGRERWYDNEESAIKYKFFLHPDYEIQMDEFVVHITKLAP